MVRGVRLTRAALHLVEGLATTAFVFPFAKQCARRKLIQRWSQRLLRILAVELEHSGAHVDPEAPMVIVANHISWLDIFVLNAHHPSRFIAKSDIRRWPLVGLLVAGVGTLFVDRTRRRDAARINAEVGAALKNGDVIALFPEGTTTFGNELLPFHGSLLQPVIEVQGHILPAAIRYTHLDGTPSQAAAYVGDTSLIESVRQLLRARRTRVRLHLAPPFPVEGRHRREIAQEAHRIIRAALELSAEGEQRGTPPG